MGTTTSERLAERLVPFLAELREDERALLIVVLTNAGDEAEVSGYDMQQLQALQAARPAQSAESASMISNILNLKHETAKSVIQNIR
jgi:hypothetical protein